MKILLSKYRSVVYKNDYINFETRKTSLAFK